jgi:hypothetical protein
MLDGITILRRRLFGISAAEVTFVRRGFCLENAAAVECLENVGHAFLLGYHKALQTKDCAELVASLEQVALTLRGFAYEGAAMSITLLEHLLPWKQKRFNAFWKTVGEKHAYMIMIGAGWAMARVPLLRRSIWGRLQRLDPLLCWLAFDGYGFHEGYFHWQRYFHTPRLVDRFSEYSRHAFAQGFGRSLWFIEGTKVTRINQAIKIFPLDLRADLWSGVGLACAYAGGASDTEVRSLPDAAKQARPSLAQGVAFAAKTRQRAGNPALHTETACQLLCGFSLNEAASITDAALEQLPANGKFPAYEIWRQRVQERFA